MEEVKAELTAQLENPVAFTIPVLGGIPVSQSVVVSWIIMAALTLAAILLTRNLKPVPGRRHIGWKDAAPLQNRLPTFRKSSGTCLLRGWGPARKWPRLKERLYRTQIVWTRLGPLELPGPLPRELVLET